MTKDLKKWKERLKRIKDYKAAKEAAEQFGGNLPDGRYKVKTNSVELTESQTSGREQVNMFVKVLEGEYEGQSVGLFLGLDEKSLPFTLSALNKLGYEIPEDPTEIVNIVESISKDLPELIIAVKNGWTSVLSTVESTKETSFEEEINKDIEEEEAEDEVDIGSTVSFEWKGKELIGEVVEIREKENKLLVKSKGKKYPVSIEKVSLVVKEEPEEESEEVEEEKENEEEKPEKKVIRKR